MITIFILISKLVTHRLWDKYQPPIMYDHSYFPRHWWNGSNFITCKCVLYLPHSDHMTYDCSWFFFSSPFFWKNNCCPYTTFRSTHVSFNNFKKFTHVKHIISLFQRTKCRRQKSKYTMDGRENQEKLFFVLCHHHSSVMLLWLT